jgi:hypothetical protein
LLFCLIPFLWGKVSDPSAGPLLSMCCDGLLIVFKFYIVVSLWILLTASGDELCGPLTALYFRQQFITRPLSSAFPVFVY